MQNNKRGPQVDVSQLFHGYQQARQRLDRAVGAQECWPVFFGLFEALNWAVVLNDAIDKVAVDRQWRNHEHGYLLDALREVRNRVHHQWANALRLERESGKLPFPGHAWVWRDLEELPAGRPSKRGEKAYICMIDHERRVAFTLANLEPILQSGMKVTTS